MLVCQVVIGKAFKTHRASPDLSGPPFGFQAVNSLPGIDFEEEEYVIYNSNALHAAYLVAYTQDTRHRTPAPVQITESDTTSLSSESDAVETSTLPSSETEMIFQGGNPDDTLPPPYTSLHSSLNIIPDSASRNAMDAQDSLQSGFPALRIDVERHTSRAFSGDHFASSPLELTFNEEATSSRHVSLPQHLDSGILFKLGKEVVHRAHWTVL